MDKKFISAKFIKTLFKPYNFAQIDWYEWIKVLENEKWAFSYCKWFLKPIQKYSRLFKLKWNKKSAYQAPNKKL